MGCGAATCLAAALAKAEGPRNANSKRPSLNRCLVGGNWELGIGGTPDLAEALRRRARSGFDADRYRLVDPDPEQFSATIRTDVTRTRGMLASGEPAVPAVWLLDDCRVVARGSGTSMPVTSTRCPT